MTPTLTTFRELDFTLNAKPEHLSLVFKDLREGSPFFFLLSLTKHNSYAHARNSESWWSLPCVVILGLVSREPHGFLITCGFSTHHPSVRSMLLPGNLSSRCCPNLCIEEFAKL